MPTIYDDGSESTDSNQDPELEVVAGVLDDVVSRAVEYGWSEDRFMKLVKELWDEQNGLRFIVRQGETRKKGLYLVKKIDDEFVWQYTWLPKQKDATRFDSCEEAQVAAGAAYAEDGMDNRVLRFRARV